jgi:hypothetical protein
MTLRRTIALLLTLFLALLFLAACADGPATLATWLGASDKPQKAPAFYYGLCTAQLRFLSREFMQWRVLLSVAVKAA